MLIFPLKRVEIASTPTYCKKTSRFFASDPLARPRRPSRFVPSRSAASRSRSLRLSIPVAGLQYHPRKLCACFLLQ